MTLGQETR